MCRSRTDRREKERKRTTMHVRLQIRVKMLLPAVYTTTRLRGWLHASFECIRFHPQIIPDNPGANLPRKLPARHPPELSGIAFARELHLGVKASHNLSDCLRFISDVLGEGGHDHESLSRIN